MWRTPSDSSFAPSAPPSVLGATDTLTVIKLKEFYTLLEDSLDRCEDVANVIESITIKNA